MPVVYSRLRAIAGRLERNESKTPTLQATALVHEVYMRLLNQRSIGWTDREHFFSFAAQIMRLILIDHARARLSGKRGGASVHVPLHDEIPWISVDGEQILALNTALDELAIVDAGKVKLVELRYVLGCTAVICPGSATGRGRSRNESTTLKMAVLAPMPSASVRTATAVKPGLRLICRTPYRTSCRKFSK